MKIYSLLLLMLLSSLSAAHTPLFDCFANDEGGITCEGGFSDGGSAQGVEIRLLDAQGKVLDQGKLDEAGSISFERPKGEFSVVCSADSEHSISILGYDIY